MNKDVIYIEPEDDITDILSNIKSAKNKIVAIVPPKKAGVLRSAVNFKLIAKTAAKADKTVVLVSADEALRKLASVVEMPVAKTLQSKPEVPGKVLRKVEKKDDVIEEEKPVKTKAAAAKEAEAIEDSKAEDDAAEEETAAAEVEQKTAKGKKAQEEADIEIDGEEEDAKDAKAAARAKKEKSGKLKVPDFKKIRLPIIVGSAAVILLIFFLVWAKISSRVDIVVKVRANTQNFAENIKLTTNSNEKDISAGVFFVEEKTIEKKSEVEFEATGEKDKGEKATGTIIVERPQGEIIDCNGSENYFAIREGTAFTYNGKKYVTVEPGSANIPDGSTEYIQTKSGNNGKNVCTLKKVVSSGQIRVQAEKPGDDYNTSGSATGWSNATMDAREYHIIGSDMTGGTSEKVKIVKEDDVKHAETELSMPTETEIREQLSSELGAGYIIIASSYKVEDSKTTASPSIDEEVKDGEKAKLVKEATYKIYAVDSRDLDEFVKKKVQDSLGDDTQKVYSTGLEDNKIYIDSFRSDDEMTAKVKSAVKTGPNIDEAKIAEIAYGEKLGILSSNLKSMNGVADAKIHQSHFWVTRVPTNPTKVSVELKIE